MKELDNFTVERLEYLKKTGESIGWPTYYEIGGGELTSLAKIALAAKQAKPVAYRVGNKIFTDKRQAEYFVCEMKTEMTNCYDAAPAVLQSPELLEVLRQLRDFVEDCYHRDHKSWVSGHPMHTAKAIIAKALGESK